MKIAKIIFLKVGRKPLHFSFINLIDIRKKQSNNVNNRFTLLAQMNRYQNYNFEMINQEATKEKKPTWWNLS